MDRSASTKKSTTSNRYCSVPLIIGLTLVLQLCWTSISGIRPYSSGFIATSVVVLPGDGGPTKTNTTIRFQFPTKEERLEYYMGSWYNISNIDNTTSLLWKDSFCRRIPFFNSSIHRKGGSDKAYIFDKHNLKEYGFDHYKVDIQRYLFSHSTARNTSLRLALSVGDQHPSLEFPVLMKSRELLGIRNQTVNQNNRIPILVLMNEARHFANLRKLAAATERQAKRKWHLPFAKKKWPFEIYDPPFETKRNEIVFRGSNTGVGNIVTRKSLIAQFQQRFNLTSNTTVATQKSGIIMDLALYPKRPMQELLQSKYLLSLEGNDVASGLKWMLYSQSIVLKPPATHVSWAMEDRLVPYFHYVPVKPDLSDLEDQLEWAHSHPDECREILRHSTAFMEHLDVSVQAKRDTKWIHHQIVQRYDEQFGQIVAKC